MKRPLRNQFLLWLVVLLLLFIVIQAIVFTFVEIVTWENEALDGPLSNNLMEVVIGVGMNVIALPLLLAAAWWIANKMVKPVKTIAETAERIGNGHLNERVNLGELHNDEMQELGRTINDALDRYHSVMDRMTRFSGDASHQLRTPLAAMRSTGEVALSQERSPEEYREMIGSMLEGINRLTTVVEQLLVLARLDSNSIENSFEPLLLDSIVTNTAELFQPLCDDRNIQLQLDISTTPPILGNAELLTQLLINLLDNAIRHTPESGSIKISLTTDETDQHVILDVLDSGSGIPLALSEEIFERFRKASGHSEGSGLGLAIVSDIATTHNGRIEIIDPGSHGAHFSVSFPVSK